LLWAVTAVVALGGLASVASQPAGAQPPAPANLANEYTLKAVFLYKFGLYVEWPAGALVEASDPFVIGIVGEDPFAGALDAIAAKKTIQERRITVRRFASVEEYRQPCHILFVSRSLTGDQQAALIAKTEGKPVFVVGETRGLAERGATANLFVDGDRIRTEINVDAARRSQLRMDAKLLSVGKLVGAKRPAGN
jgi:hypothetical protein